MSPVIQSARTSTSGDALRDVVPVVVGYLTLGLAAGMLLAAAGLDWWWAPVWSLLIYSGTMQMLLVPLVAAGAPLASIAASTLFVSGRHVFYGLSFPLDRVRAGTSDTLRGRAARLYAVHAITDEVFALLASKDRSAMSARYVLVVEVVSQASWCVGTTLGALAGAWLSAVVGERVQLLGFVLTSLFVVLAIENWRAHPDVAVAGAGVVAGALGIAAGGGAVLLVALSVLSVELVGLYLWRRRRSRLSDGAAAGQVGASGQVGAAGAGGPVYAGGATSQVGAADAGDEQPDSPTHGTPPTPAAPHAPTTPTAPHAPTSGGEDA